MLGMGDFYAVRPLMDMDIPAEPGVLRMSFLHYTSMEEIDQLIDRVKDRLIRSYSYSSSVLLISYLISV